MLDIRRLESPKFIAIHDEQCWSASGNGLAESLGTAGLAKNFDRKERVSSPTELQGKLYIAGIDTVGSDAIASQTSDDTRDCRDLCV